MLTLILLVGRIVLWWKRNELRGAEFVVYSLLAMCLPYQSRGKGRCVVSLHPTAKQEGRARVI